MSTSPKQRLQELKDLLDAGRIDDAEYASLRQSALNDLGMPPRGAIAAQGGGTDAGYGKGDMLGADDRRYKLVQRAGLTMEDIQIAELNEAFAAQSSCHARGGEGRLYVQPRPER